MGSAFLLVGIAGFCPFITSAFSREDTGAPAALILHAVVMFGWLVVFVVQSLLPHAGRLTLHKLIGYTSVGLFLALWVSSITISIGSFTSDFSPPIRQLINNLFLLQIVAWILSPILFVLAFRSRAINTADHKRYMLLLTFFLIEAAASRIDWLPGMSNEKYWIIYQYLYLDIFLIALVIYDRYSLGRMARATKIGVTMFAIYQLFAVAMWDSELWINAADRLLTLLSQS